MPKPLTIEFGALDASCTEIPFRDPIGYGCASAMNSADELVKKCPDIDFTLLPYEGTSSPLSGGRKEWLSSDDLIRTIGLYNAEGYPFAVPFNGGLRFRETTFDVANDPRFETEMKVLHALADSGAKYGVDNHVTITHDSLLSVVREHFPELTTVASCIRFVGGRRGEFGGVDEYRRAFEDFDLVVPLNQHTTWQFLSQFRDRVDQMLLFLNMECSRNDQRECYKCYCGYEEMASGSDELVGAPVPAGDFDCLVSPDIGGLDPRLRNQCNNKGAKLAEREDIIDLALEGVNKFKIARRRHHHPLDHEDTRGLAHFFNNVVPDQQIG